MAQSKKQNEPPGALFVFDTWDKNKYGLPAFHRHLVKILGKKKIKPLQLYSTVLSDEISEKHKQDAVKLGVTLIKARRKPRIPARDDPVRLAWLHNFESYYPDFSELKNIRYIIGYSPKTGDAAADIRDGAFPSAQLVLINHASPENDCTLVHQETLQEFHQRMLKMASAADLIFSMGPKRHSFFKNRYRLCIGEKNLAAIPHKEIPPLPHKSFFKKKLTLGEAIKHDLVLLTYGKIDNDHLVQALEGLASSVSSVVEASHNFHSDLPGWNILGVPSAFNETVCNLFKTKITSDFVSPQLFEHLDLESLATNLCQSHVCLPIRCYDEYSFDGLEALALGVPLLIAEYSHLAGFIKKYLPKYYDQYIVRMDEQPSAKIISTLREIERAFEMAGEQKCAFMANKDVTYSYETFAAMLTDDTGSDGNETDNLNPQITHRKKAAENGQQICEEFYQQESQYEGTQHSDQTEPTQKPVTTRTERVHASTDQRPRDVIEDSLPENQKSGSAELTVTIRLNEEDFQEAIRTLDSETGEHINEAANRQEEENDSPPLRERKLTIQIIIKENNKSFWDRVHDALNGNNAKQFIDFLVNQCKDNHATLLKVSEGSLVLRLKFSCLQNLCKFEGNCKTGIFTQPLERFLITDEMRTAAEKASTPLHLVAVYDDEKFEEVSRFLIKRDGGFDLTDDSTSSDDNDDNERKKQESPFVVDCSKKPTTVKKEETIGAEGDDMKIPSDFGQAKGKQTGRQEELDEGSYDSEADEGYDEPAVGEVKLSAKRDWKTFYFHQLLKWVKNLMGHTVIDINEEWSVQILGLQKSGTKQGLFNNPNGLRWHHGQLLICDTDNNRIQILAKNYYYQSVDEIRFDSMTNAFQPWAVNVYRKEYYISDIGNNQIVICDHCHEILQTIAVSPDISVHSITVMAGLAVVTDHKGNKVLKYNKKGNLVAKYQGQGSENTLIKYPHSVAPASNGSILVSDANNHNIKVLDSDLNYVESFCAEGTGEGEVRYPQGIDVDARGNIYICDKLNNRIVKLGSNGNFLHNLFEGDLEYPTNIAVNVAGDEIAVSVFGNIARPVNQIRVFFKNKLNSLHTTQ